MDRRPAPSAILAATETEDRRSWLIRPFVLWKPARQSIDGLGPRHGLLPDVQIAIAPDFFTRHSSPATRHSSSYSSSR